MRYKIYFNDSTSWTEDLDIEPQKLLKMIQRKETIHVSDSLYPKKIGSIINLGFVKKVIIVNKQETKQKEKKNDSEKTRPKDQEIHFTT